jgi:hypothetical protein
MPSPRHLISTDAQRTEESGLADLRRSLATLGRLRAGWRPDERLLADVRCAERWTVTRHDDAKVYQFVGHVAQHPEPTSMTIATVLAIDPDAGWTLLAGDRWLRIGDALPTQPLPSSSDVAECAESWLLQEIQNCRNSSTRAG